MVQFTQLIFFKRKSRFFGGGVGVKPCSYLFLNNYHKSYHFNSLVLSNHTPFLINFLFLESLYVGCSFKVPFQICGYLEELVVLKNISFVIFSLVVELISPKNLASTTLHHLTKLFPCNFLHSRHHSHFFPIHSNFLLAFVIIFQSSLHDDQARAIFVYLSFLPFFLSFNDSPFLPGVLMRASGVIHKVRHMKS